MTRKNAYDEVDSPNSSVEFERINRNIVETMDGMLRDDFDIVEIVNEFLEAGFAEARVVKIISTDFPELVETYIQSFLHNFLW